ncbi:MAG: choice-of-anchor D domain-containing protein [Actinomycetota bacterium]
MTDKPEETEASQTPAEPPGFAPVRPGRMRPPAAGPPPPPGAGPPIGTGGEGSEDPEAQMTREERARFLAVRPGEARPPSAPGFSRPEPPRVGVTISLSPTEAIVDPGAEVAFEVLVRNTGTVVDQFTIQVSDEAARWTSVEPPALNLYPGSDPGVAIVRFTPPRSPFTPAGPARFEVRAVSREDSNISAVARGTLNVEAFYNLTAGLVPQTSQGRRKGEHRLTVTNQGNTRINAAVTTTDPDNLLGFYLDPSTVTAEPGREAASVVRVYPRKLRWLGNPLNRPFQVTGVAEGAPPLQVQGQFEHIPLLPRWVPKAAIVLFPLLIILIVYLVQTAPLPRVANFSTGEARERLRDRGFRQVSDLQEESGNVPKGDVIRSDPDSGRKRKTTNVKIVTSQGLRVPNVLGQDEAGASSKLQEQGLVVGNILFEPSKEPAGKVIGTDPAPNALVSTGSAVTLRISSGTATLMANPSSLTLPSQPVGSTSPPQTVTLTNQGTGNLTVSSVDVGGANAGDFAVTGDSCRGTTVAPAGSCTVQVAFTPAGAGARSASLSIASNAAGGSPSVALSGTGLTSEIAVSVANLAFDNQKVGTSSAAQTVTVTNKGDAPMSMGEATVTGDNASDFNLNDGCKGATVAPGSACTVSIVFTPPAGPPPGKGARNAKLNLSTVSGNGQSVALSGKGTVPVARTDKQFLKMEVPGGPTTGEVAVTNGGDAAMIVRVPAIEGEDSKDFKVIANECRSDLAPNSSCKIAVEWTNTASTCSQAVLAIPTDDPDVPTLYVALVGHSLSTECPPPTIPPNLGA